MLGVKILSIDGTNRYYDALSPTDTMKVSAEPESWVFLYRIKKGNLTLGSHLTIGAGKFVFIEIVRVLRNYKVRLI